MPHPSLDAPAPPCRRRPARLLQLDALVTAALLVGIAPACDGPRPEATSLPSEGAWPAAARVSPPATPPDPAAVVEAARRALAEAGITTLRWSVTPGLESQVESRPWRGLAALVTEPLGVRVELVRAHSYTHVTDLLARQELDVAILAPFSYVTARERIPGLRAFATQVSGGSDNYGAYVIARDGGPVQRLSDLVGRPFAFVDPLSTSGWLYPAAHMLEHAIHPLDDLEATFLGSHGAVYDAVATGRADAGALSSSAMRTGQQRHPGVHIRIVAKTRRIPFDAYVAREGLPDEVVTALALGLRGVTTKTRAGRRALAPLGGVNGFLPVDDSHYDGIREVARRVRPVTPAPGATADAR